MFERNNGSVLEMGGLSLDEFYDIPLDDKNDEQRFIDPVPVVSCTKVPSLKKQFNDNPSQVIDDLWKSVDSEAKPLIIIYLSAVSDKNFERFVARLKNNTITQALKSQHIYFDYAFVRILSELSDNKFATATRRLSQFSSSNLLEGQQLSFEKIAIQDSGAFREEFERINTPCVQIEGSNYRA